MPKPTAKPGDGVVQRYIAEQPADKTGLLRKIDALVRQAMPDAEVTIKWGVPVYQKAGRNVCALASFKEHVGLNFFVPALPDPKKKLEGGKTNRMLKIRSAGEIQSAEILRWVKAAASR
ncbi:MAG: DUF1801 domain-containing protein [Candidatus Limnocylindria bacterium]